MKNAIGSHSQDQRTMVEDMMIQAYGAPSTPASSQL
jgi:hypothetical protein